MIIIETDDFLSVKWAGKLEDSFPDWLKTELDTISSPFTEGSIAISGNIMYIGSNIGLLKIVPGNWVVKYKTGKVIMATDDDLKLLIFKGKTPCLQ